MRGMTGRLSFAGVLALPDEPELRRRLRLRFGVVPEEVDEEVEDAEDVVDEPDEVDEDDELLLDLDFDLGVDGVLTDVTDMAAGLGDPEE